VQVTEVTRASPVKAQQGIVEDAWAAWREKSEAGLWQLVCWALAYQSKMIAQHFPLVVHLHTLGQALA